MNGAIEVHCAAENTRVSSSAAEDPGAVIHGKVLVARRQARVDDEGGIGSHRYGVGRATHGRAGVLDTKESRLDFDVANVGIRHRADITIIRPKERWARADLGDFETSAGERAPNRFPIAAKRSVS